MNSERKLETRGVPSQATRCPYCHESVDVQGRFVVCGTCLARQHEDCCREHGACASCGSERVLHQEATAGESLGKVAASELPKPPLGSKIEASAEGEELLLSWRLQMPIVGPWALFAGVVSLFAFLVTAIGLIEDDSGALVVCFVLWLIVALLGAGALVARLKLVAYELRLGPSGLHLTVPAGPFGAGRERQAPWSELGKIKVENSGIAGMRLSVDFGIERVSIGEHLTEPEQEWLHDQLISAALRYSHDKR